MSEKLPKPLHKLVDSIEDVKRLADIHTEVTGDKPGRRDGVEVLNKSAIVMLVAAWEVFIEEAANESFEFLLTNAKDHNAFSDKVLTLSSKKIRGDQDERKVWQLAGNGWRKILRSHKDKVLNRYIGTFHGPETKNVNELFDSLVGIKSVSRSWYWKGMSKARSQKKLDDIVNLRHQIAHKTKATKTIKKSEVESYYHFIHRLAACTTNRIADDLGEKTNKVLWDYISYSVD